MSTYFPFFYLKLSNFLSNTATNYYRHLHIDKITKILYYLFTNKKYSKGGTMKKYKFDKGVETPIKKKEIAGITVAKPEKK